jgi:DNA (cytosine-5)-methyltransferase 1
MRSTARQIKYILFDGENPKVPLKKIDYLPFLEQCWQEHLQPKQDNAPTVISTFAGCGGSSLGYSMAGFKELLAIEWDDNAVETFKLNFPDVSVYHGDIAKISVDQVLEMTRLQPGQLDIFDGSPPCQGFSMAGKRDFSDDRNQLFREYVRLLRGLKPKVFVMENVSGMVKGVMKIVFAEIMRELKASGYNVSARLLNAMYFNVPQSRQRLIFIGVREDLKIKPSHPEADNIPITVREAINNVINNEIELYFVNHIKESVIYPRICKMKIGDSYSDFSPHGSGFTLQRNWLDKCSRTITKTVNHSASSDGTLHPIENRKHTISEIKRLHSFPNSYVFIGKFIEQWARIGNSVPPLFMRSIALHIKNNILNKLKTSAQNSGVVINQ